MSLGATYLEAVLAGHAGKCLDTKSERQLVAKHLARLLRNYERRIARRRCADCDHLDEVHQTDAATGEHHCLGGPETHCDCQGFNKGRR